MEAQLVFPWRDSDLGCLMWGLNSLLFREDFHVCDISPMCGSLHQGCRSWLDHGSVPPTCLNVAFSLYLQVWKGCSTGLQVVFRERVVLYVVVVLVCPWEVVSSGFSCSAILIFSPLHNYVSIGVITTLNIFFNLKFMIHIFLYRPNKFLWKYKPQYEIE